MRLVSFSAQNYRSISKASKLPLHNMTVLIGPNNEGKSNLLRALVAALTVIAGAGRASVYRGRVLRTTSHNYRWDRDYPVKLQQRRPGGESIFTVEFELTDDEIKQFWTDVKSHITGTLPIQITLGNGPPGFKVIKKGPGAAALSKKAPAIAEFIAARLDFQYIPAVRTAERARGVVEDMIARSLASAERDPSYTKALEDIERAQAPLFTQIEESIKETLAVFLPDVKQVSVQVSREERSIALRKCEITIDDGTPTLLQYKGDGVQSLAALSLMRHASVLGAGDRQLVLAIEEPESHLHPRAIHQLKGVLKEISEKHQIIMTTHCPLFVDRANLRSNILVSASRATPARSVGAIRNLLGVRVADNLSHAELVLLVEGLSDRSSLLQLLAYSSPKLKAALNAGTLAIDPMHGVGSLSYKLTQWRDAICVTHAFIDDDKVARDAAQKAEQDGLLAMADLNYSVCPGMSEAEFEDMVDPSLYAKVVKNLYGVDLSIKPSRSKEKWSRRMHAAFRAHGKQWSEGIETDLKGKIADLVAASPYQALNAYKRSSFDALVRALEDKLDQIAFLGV